MSRITGHHVYLSGGGIKGAYQYGFFQELYRQRPAFEIKRLYTVSIGSINALPILTKRMDILETYWDAKDGTHPMDLITHKWSPEPVSWLSHLVNLKTRGALFKGLQRRIFEEFIRQIPPNEIKAIRRKWVIVSFDERRQHTVFTRCTDEKTIVDAIVASSRYPGIFPRDDLDTRIDGAFSKWLPPIDHRHDWLIIDLQDKTRCPEAKHVRCRSYSPKIARVPGFNTTTCILTNRPLIQHLIQNGIEDGARFADTIP